MSRRAIESPVGSAGTGQRSLDLIAMLARSLLTRLDAVVDTCVAQIVDSEAAYRDGLVQRDDLWRSCRDNLQLYMEALAAPGGRTAGVSAQDQAAAGETGRRRAAQGFPLEALLHAYRVGGRVVWQGLVAEARAQKVTDTDALLDGATVVWEVMDVQSDAVAAAYQQTQTDLARRGELRAQAAFDALIDGTVPGRADLADQARALGLPADDSYVVVSAEMGGDGLRPLDHPRRALREAGVLSAWRVRPLREVGVIALSGQPLDRVVVPLRGVATGRAGVSPPVDDLAAISRAFGMAEIALRTVPEGCDGVALLDEQLDAALVVEAPLIARRLRARVLGPFDALGDQERAVLMETVRALLQATGSASAAAALLYCHRNTVANRLRRIEELTSLSMADAGSLATLHLAVLADDLVARSSSPDLLED